jgi:hypothetical protein
MVTIPTLPMSAIGRFRPGFLSSSPTVAIFAYPRKETKTRAFP